MKTKVKTIAFYLPQFHPIPENDLAYGEGFTEWVNVKKAVPLYKNHYQPRVPLNENYYSLLDPSVMVEQAKMAKEYGIYGFCYYHYWFSGGKKLLEKPIEMMLENKDVDIPFCLCWANENWTRRWDGGNNEVIVAQDYGDKEDIVNHVEYLCRFFEDSRYIKIGGSPLLVIYKPEIIPNIKRYIRILRKCALEQGYKLKIAVQYPRYFINGFNLNLFDYYIQFQPAFFAITPSVTSQIKALMNSHGLNKIVKICDSIKTKNRKKQSLKRLDYKERWDQIINYEVKNKKLIAGAFVDWDNTARNKNGLVYQGASPDIFEKEMKLLVDKIHNEYKNNVMFINAWNEWAEGCYLEPDEKNKYGYLEALKKSLESYNGSI